MRVLFLSLLLLPLFLHARENPFAPAQASDVQQAAEIPVKDENNSDEPQIAEIPEGSTSGKEVVNYAKARFVFRENSAYIETKDELIKHFAIATPPSIVIDFKAPSDFASKRKELTTVPFVKLEMGAHGDRYRVVLRLDREHSYRIEKKRYGQFLTITD